ncbi:secretory pathway protein Sec39-domain-containing protein [Zopfochytrium polystomum]|nr:secretory pathway protein Sec39-domain-containing protein [Zopfochytrium polystomum]
MVTSRAAQLVGATPAETRSALRAALADSDDITVEQIDAEIEALLLDVDENSSQALSSLQDGRSITDRCFERRSILDALDRLDSYEEVYGPRRSGPNPLIAHAALPFLAHFQRLISGSLVLVAADLAAHGDIHGLDILFTRHGKTLVPYRLFILSQLPLTMDPTGYKGVLPRLDIASGKERAWPTVPWRRPDWTETNDSVRSLLEDLTEDHEEKLATIPRFDDMLSADALADWYVSRIVQIESVTGQADLSFALCKIAVAHVSVPVAKLERKLHELATLTDLVYGCGEVLLDLNGVLPMDMMDVLQLQLFSTVGDPEILAWRIKQYSLPYIARLRNLGRSEAELDATFDLCLLQIAGKNLAAAAKVFELSRPGIPQSERIIQSNARLARLILECSYGTDDKDISIEVYQNLARSMPLIEEEETTEVPKSGGWDDDVDFDAENSGNSTTRELVERINLFDAHVDALELLRKYGFHESLRLFVDQDFKSPTAQNPDDSQWIVLHDDLCHAQNLGLFGCCTAKDCSKEFLRAALTFARFEVVKVVISAANFPLNSKDIEEIVIDAAKEYYDNASGWDKKTDLKLASDCLRICSPTPAVANELNLIDATDHLARLYRNLAPYASLPLPIEIRLHSDRLDIIASLLQKVSHPGSIDVKKMLDIARKLTGVSDSNTDGNAVVEVDLRVRGMVAAWALDIGDFDYAVTVCADMVASAPSSPRVGPPGSQNQTSPASIEEAWRVCLRLIGETRSAASLTNQLRKDLVGFALAWCEPHSVGEILDAARAAEMAVALQGLGEGSLLQGFGLLEAENKVRGRLADIPMPSGLEASDLPLHPFYEPVVGFRRDSGREFEDIDLKSESRMLKERLLFLEMTRRCKAPLKRKLAISFQETSHTEIDVRDSDLVRLALEAFQEEDFSLSMMYLFNLHHAAKAETFFDALKPSLPADHAAVLYFTTQVLLARSNSSAVAISASIDPFQIIDYAKLLVNQSNTDSPQDNPDVLHSIRKFLNRNASDEASKIVESICRLPSVDPGQFKTDSGYQHQVLLSIARGLGNDENFEFEEALSIAPSFGVSASEMLLERLCWLACNPSVSGKEFENGVVRFRASLDGTQLFTRLCECHSKAKSGGPQKMAVFYSLLADLAVAERASHQLLRRVDVIRDLEQPPFSGVFPLSLEQIISNNYLEEPSMILAYQEILEALPSTNVVAALLKALPSLTGLEYLSEFPDESPGPRAVPANVSQSLQTSLALRYLGSLLEEVDWEFEDAEKIEADFSTVSRIVFALEVPQLVKVLTIYGAGEQAGYAPSPLRIDLIGTVMDRLREIPSDDAAEALTLTKSIMKHCNLIHALSTLSAPSGSDSIPFDRVQQFDWTYGEPPEEVRSLCMKMIIAGRHPSIVSQAVNLLHDHFADPIFETTSIYADAISSVLGLPLLGPRPMAPVFRQGVEPPADALSRIVGAVFKMGSALHTSPEPPKKADGWDDFDPSGTALAKPYPNTAAILDAAVRLELNQLSIKYFGSGVLPPEELVRAELDAVVSNGWEIQISGSDLDNDDAKRGLIQRLIAGSETFTHFDALCQSLSIISKSGMEVFPDCWKEAFAAAASRGFYDALIQFRLASDTMPVPPLTDEVFAESARALSSFGTIPAVAEALKLELLSSSPDESAAHSLLAKLLLSFDSSSPLFSDTLLHYLIVATGLAPRVPSAVLSRLIDSLLSTASRPKGAPGPLPLPLQHHLTRELVVSLVLARKITAAAAIVSRLTTARGGLAPTVIGVTARAAALRGFLRHATLAVAAPEEEGMWGLLQRALDRSEEGYGGGKARAADALRCLEGLLEGRFITRVS